MTIAVENSLRHLLGRLAVIEARVEEAVARRRQSGGEVPNRFRGLYVSDALVDVLLSRPDALRCDVGDADARWRVPDDPGSRLAILQSRFGLSDFEVDILLAALAPDFDPRFEKLYGYLHDDVTRRCASVGLSIELAGRDCLDAVARDAFADSGSLRRYSLLTVQDLDRPHLTRAVRVPDAVTSYLLGSDRPAATLAAAIRTPPRHIAVEGAALARAIAQGVRTVYCRHSGAMWAASVAVGTLDACLVVEADETGAVAASAARHAALHGQVLVLGPVERMPSRVIDAACPVVLFGTDAWDPVWSCAPVLELDWSHLGRAAAPELWRDELGSESGLASSVESFRLSPDQVSRAVAAARLSAAAAGRALDGEALAAGARAQNAAGLTRLARRVRPAATWDDLIVPPATDDGLRHFVDRVRWRDTVLDKRGLRRGAGRGEGVAALFAGEPGTGKTLAAEVIANALGLDLYVIDLSAVVDKYVGETEKNLEQIFAEAEGVNGVLFFDEADALFGRRSAVSDAHDRYANVETSYLLQRMESFDGVAILATNLVGNMDDAFTRRLTVVVEFVRPGVEERRRLWSRALSSFALADDVHLDTLATAYDLTGAEMRGTAMTLAHKIPAGGPVTQHVLDAALTAERRKVGRL